MQLCVVIEEDRNTQLHDELKQVLKDNAVVFEEPTQLPPSRSYDHTILVLLGAKPMNLRPYKVPHPS